MGRPKPRAWVGDFERWVPRFMDNVRRKAKARKVWRCIQQHCETRDHPAQSRMVYPAALRGGLVYQAAMLLFTAAQALKHLELDDQYERVQRIDALGKRAEKAASVAESGPPRPGRGRPRLQAEEAMRTFLNAPWPATSKEAPGLRTVQDALELVKPDTGRDFSLAELRKLIVQTCGPKQSPLRNGLWQLAQLKKLAAEYGLKLGHKKIAHLCHCAEIGVNERTLAWYFASLSPDDWNTVSDSLSIIRRGLVRRDKYPALFARLRRN
jgi:hypothetical protein